MTFERLVTLAFVGYSFITVKIYIIIYFPNFILLFV